MIARLLVLSALLALAAVGSVQAAPSNLQQSLINQALANDQSNDQASYQSQDNLYYAADASEADSDVEFTVNQFGWGGGFGRGYGGGFGRGGFGRGGWGGGFGRGGFGGGFGRGGFGW